MSNIINKFNKIYYYLINNINSLAGLYIILCLFISYNLVILNPYNFWILIIYGLFIEITFNYISSIYKKIKYFLKK